MSRVRRYWLGWAVIAVVPIGVVLALPKQPAGTVTISGLESALLALALTALLLTGALSLVARTGWRRRAGLQPAAATVAAVQQDWPHATQWPVSQVGAVLNVARGLAPSAPPVLVAALLDLATRRRYRLLPAQSTVPGFDVDLAIASGDSTVPLAPTDVAAAQLAAAALEHLEDGVVGVALGELGAHLAHSSASRAATLGLLEAFELQLQQWLLTAGLLGQPSRLLRRTGAVLAGVSVVALVVGAVAAVADAPTDWSLPLALMWLLLGALGWFLTLASDNVVVRGLTPTGQALAYVWQHQLAAVPAVHVEDVIGVQLDARVAHVVVAGRAPRIALGARIDDPWRQVAWRSGPRGILRLLRHRLAISSLHV